MVFIQKEIIIVAKIIYLFIFQQDVLQSHISCSFLLVKIFGYLAFWQVSFFVVAKVKVMCKNVCQVGGVVFFQPVSLQVQPHPTKRPQKPYHHECGRYNPLRPLRGAPPPNGEERPIWRRVGRRLFLISGGPKSAGKGLGNPLAK